jgi:Family of unknown function (DUF6629)
VCFSAEADLVGGVVIGAIGIDVLRHLDGRRRYAPLASLPLLFAAHQLDEAFVWWGLQGDVPSGIGRVATWIYLLFAFVVLPTLVPIAILALEPPGRRRGIILPFVGLGVIVSAVLLAAMIRGPVDARLGSHYIAYSTDLRADVLVVGAYVAATCGSLICSGIRPIAVFGIVNLIVVALLARATLDGFASLWCAWAAISSAAFAVHLRFGPRIPLPLRPDTATS